MMLFTHLSRRTIGKCLGILVGLVGFVVMIGVGVAQQSPIEKCELPLVFPCFLEDNLGFRWVIQADGSILRSFHPTMEMAAFDGGIKLLVSVKGRESSFPSDRRVRLEEGGQEIVFESDPSRPNPYDPLRVHRRILVPSDNAFVVFLEVLENPSGEKLDVTVRIESKLAPYSVIATTSSGDRQFRWERDKPSDQDYYVVIDEDKFNEGFELETGPRDLIKRPLNLRTVSYDKEGKEIDKKWEIVCEGDALAKYPDKRSGKCSVRAGIIDHNQRTQLKLENVEVATRGKITFHVKTDSELGKDLLKFKIDDQEMPSSSLSGRTAWERKEFDVAAGKRTFLWEYAKDASRSEGSDTAWLDDISWPPLKNIVTGAPAVVHVISGAGTNVPIRPNLAKLEGDKLSYGYTLEIPPRSTRILVHWAALRETSEGAQDIGIKIMRGAPLGTLTNFFQKIHNRYLNAAIANAAISPGNPVISWERFQDPYLRWRFDLNNPHSSNNTLTAGQWHIVLGVTFPEDPERQVTSLQVDLYHQQRIGAPKTLLKSKLFEGHYPYKDSSKVREFEESGILFNTAGRSTEGIYSFEAKIKSMSPKGEKLNDGIEVYFVIKESSSLGAQMEQHTLQRDGLALQGTFARTLLNQVTSSLRCSIIGALRTDTEITDMAIAGDAAEVQRLYAIGLTPSGEAFLHVIDLESQREISRLSLLEALSPEPYRALGRPFIALTRSGSKAYLTSFFDNQVIVIGFSPFVVTTIATGPGPADIAITPDNRGVLVLNSSGASLSVIETETDQVVATIALTGSRSISFDLVGNNRAYVVNEADTSIEVVDIEANGVVATIPLPFEAWQPRAIACLPAWQKCYVASYLNDVVSIIETKNNTILNTLRIVGLRTATPGAWHLAASPDNKRVYVSNSIDQSISIIDTATDQVIGTIRVIPEPSTRPVGPLIVSPNNKRVYVTEGGIGLNVLECE